MSPEVPRGPLFVILLGKARQSRQVLPSNAVRHSDTSRDPPSLGLDPQCVCLTTGSCLLRDRGNTKFPSATRLNGPRCICCWEFCLKRTCAVLYCIASQYLKVVIEMTFTAVPNLMFETGILYQFIMSSKPLKWL